MTTSPLFKRVPTWEVCVSLNGDNILTVGTNILAGADMTPENETIVRQAAHHLLSFLGDSFAASPEPPAEEVEALRKDAARYRWLRNDNAFAPEEEVIRGGDELDEYIDREIARAKGAG